LLRSLPGTVSEPLAFEARSAIGRLFARRLRHNPNESSYLNLGAGNDRFEGYIGVDFFSGATEYGADLRYPLLIDDAVFDGIFTEHTLEHFTYAEVARILAECNRIMKPGGWIRIIVPDLSIFIENYTRNDSTWFQEWEREVLQPRGRRLLSSMEALSFVTQEYGHRSAWDFATMARLLERAGFTAIRKCALGEGSDPRLLRDKEDCDRAMVSLYVEARKLGGGS
jgi:predicted SAM-dependent methyltransferase